jgi:CPA1 family monovalent cation:H+ antiporter
VLELIIPPLLYAAAINASLLQIRSQLRTIASLSVLLVVATAMVVGVTLNAVDDHLTFAAALALGAAVAPPDPVAALAIGRRAHLPNRLMTLIEGEGLLNDATALTIYSIAVAAVTSGGRFTFGHGLERFVLSVLGGLAAGLAIAAIVRFLRRYLDDPLLENAVSIATPFGAYALAEEIHTSGVLAVVVAGLWIGHQAPLLESGAARLQTRAVWRLVEFVLEGYVFLLIGQQAPEIMGNLDLYPTTTVIAASAVSVGGVLLVRPAWLLWLRRVSNVSGGTPLSGKDVIALSWSGTRGVITLATAAALPLTFPDRHLLLFCAYLVVLVTLVGQGLTFAPLLRMLKLRSDESDERRMRAEARLAAVDAALQRLDEVVEREEVPDVIERRLRTLYAARRERAQLRLSTLDDDEAMDAYASAAESLGMVRRNMIEAEREELVRWRDAGRLPDSSLRMLQRELDHQEGLLPG